MLSVSPHKFGPAGASRYDSKLKLKFFLNLKASNTARSGGKRIKLLPETSSSGETQSDIGNATTQAGNASSNLARAPKNKWRGRLAVGRSDLRSRLRRSGVASSTHPKSRYFSQYPTGAVREAAGGSAYIKAQCKTTTTFPQSCYTP